MSKDKKKTKEELAKEKANEEAFQKKLKEMKKRDPFIYKNF